jgi:hypothetical protein
MSFSRHFVYSTLDKNKKCDQNIKYVKILSAFNFIAEENWQFAVQISILSTF